MSDMVLINEIVARVLDRLAAELPHLAGAPENAELNRLVEHTLLKPDATGDDVNRLCDEAVHHDFYAVCVQPVFVELAAERLREQRVNVVSVVDFPLGASSPRSKAYQAREVIDAGADEVDMVLPVGLLKDCRWSGVADHVDAVVHVARERDCATKVIIETSLLTDREKVIACAISEACGADFVKTSTGFAHGGATVEDVRLMRQVVGERLGVKAAGGIRTREFARELVDAGASRLGTSSGPSLVAD